MNKQLVQKLLNIQALINEVLEEIIVTTPTTETSTVFTPIEIDGQLIKDSEQLPTFPSEEQQIEPVATILSSEDNFEPIPEEETITSL